MEKKTPFITILKVSLIILPIALSAYGCPINEVYALSGPLCENCGPRCLALSNEPKCYCKPGFSRYGNHGICVLDSACPKTDPTGNSCPINEEYSDCGSGCPETCESIRDPFGRACAAVCVAGCFCRSGLVRNSKGICVPRSLCPQIPTCPVNEEYTECGSCPETCDSIWNPEGRACAAVCVKGCICKKGLVRNNRNICVPPYQCPPPNSRCGPNEIPGCSQPAACQTCEHPSLCQTFVCNPGCVCRPGFYRHFGICIPEAFCPNPTCPVNEEYLKCGSSCPETCDSIWNPHGRGCAAVCVEGCFCKRGLVRNNRNICVPPYQCQPPNNRCGPNEIPGCWQPSDCQTCEHPSLCPTFVCQPGCICRPGFYRRFGICIPEAFCRTQPQVCPPFEELRNNGPACEGCPPRCLGISHVRKCYCIPEFVRINGVCRPMRECRVY